MFTNYFPVISLGEVGEIGLPRISTPKLVESWITSLLQGLIALPLASAGRRVISPLADGYIGASSVPQGLLPLPRTCQFPVLSCPVRFLVN